LQCGGIRRAAQQPVVAGDEDLRDGNLVAAKELELVEVGSCRLDPPISVFFWPLVPSSLIAPFDFRSVQIAAGLLSAPRIGRS
jgi:hypothetical protein